MLPIASLPHDDPTFPAAPFLPIRALLLDDSDFDQRRIERMARDSGLMIKFHVAENLESMAELLEIREFDIALLDYRLPIGSGRDALVLLRDNQANCDCATIMVAGDDLLDETAQDMRDSCDSFISKDRLSPDLLRAAVTAILNERAYEKARHPVQSSATLPEWQLEIEANLEGLIREIRDIKYLRQSGKLDLAASLSKLERRTIRIWSDIRQKGAAIIGQEAKFDILAGRHTGPGRAH